MPTFAAALHQIKSVEINEIDFIISNNASNIASAFPLTFPMAERTNLTNDATDTENCLDNADDDYFRFKLRKKQTLKKELISVPGKNFAVLLIHCSL